MEEIMEKGDLKVIEQKLDILIKLYAYQLVAGKNMPEGVPILRRLGLSASEIAAVYDTSANTVSVRLAESKKKTIVKAKKTVK
jgi:hypothetical protein